MSVQYNAVTVDTAATLILASNPARRGCMITNNGSVTVYLGMNASVASINGIPLPSNANFSLDGEHADYRGSIYGIVTSSTAECRFWEWEN